jgi:hypothetical protein
MEGCTPHVGIVYNMNYAKSNKTPHLRGQYYITREICTSYRSLNIIFPLINNVILDNLIAFKFNTCVYEVILLHGQYIGENKITTPDLYNSVISLTPDITFQEIKTDIFSDWL